MFSIHLDTCYILAYSTIMLNTSLHNPSVKDKLTVEKFVSMNRGIDGGKDLPPDLLTVRVAGSVEVHVFKGHHTPPYTCCLLLQ